MKTIFENDNEGKPTKDLPKRKGRWVLGKENATIIKTLMLPKLICQPNMISAAAAAAAKLLQLCQTLCNPTDSSPPGSAVPGILQARTLEWVAISFSNAWKWSCPVVSDSSQPHGLQPTRLLRSWDFPGKSTGVGCHCLNRHNISWYNC